MFGFNLTGIAALSGALLGAFIGYQAGNIFGQFEGARGERAKWEQAAKLEAEVQKVANTAALNVMEMQIEELTRKRRELEETLEEIAREAEADPDAGRDSISADGVRRLNRVR